MKTKNSKQPYGTYALTYSKKWLYNLAQKLPKTSLGFKFALVLRKLVLMNRLQLVDAEQFGLKLRLYPLDNLGDRFLLFMPKFFEYDEFKLMSEHLSPDSTFIDIGGNMGIYSLTAAKYINESGTILSFEPNPQMIERFKFNRHINGFDKSIKIKEIGVADQEMQFSLALHDSNLGAASIVQDHGNENLTINCRRLLDVLNEENIKHIDLLKIDIEEAEPLALNPFFATAPRSLFPKIIIIESDEGVSLKEFGYEPLGDRTIAHNMIYKLTSNLKP
jgi:FkbM family methyltransferase